MLRQEQKIAPGRSWYEDTAGDPPTIAPVDLSQIGKVDICIIGAGFTGFGAAIELANKGYKVLILEQNTSLTKSASARNGGQIHPVFNSNISSFFSKVGQENALALWNLIGSAREYQDQLLEKIGDQCERQAGVIHAGYDQIDADDFTKTRDEFERYIDASFATLLSERTIKEKIKSPHFTSGLLFKHGGHIHSLKYLYGMARLCIQKNVMISLNTKAIDFKEIGQGIEIRTEAGAVRSEKLVLAGNGLMQGLSSRVDRRIVPIKNYIITTKPLSEQSQTRVIPGGEAVSDTRFVVNYFRETKSGSLLFGGGESYLSAPGDIGKFVRPAVERVFPQLENVKYSHAWGGTLGITASRFPYVTSKNNRIFVAAGYSGIGVLLAPFFGHLLGKAISGDRDHFDLLSKMKTMPFPGGRYAAKPLAILAFNWLSLRDKLGF